MKDKPLVLFGTDGVRGIAGKPPLTPALIRQLGAAAAKIYKSQMPGASPVFLMGRDTRESGSWIAKAFAQGARSQDVICREVGIVATPSLAYLVPHRSVLGGVMISASHNPAEFNGIKLFGPDGRKCPDAWERSIEKQIQSARSVPVKRVSISRDAKGLSDYLAFLKSTLPKGLSFRGLRIVIDCSHGSLSKIAPTFLKRLGISVIATGAQPNGKNINDHVGSQHPEKLQRLVVEKKAHGGIAFDGDADRVIFCDESGRLLDGDYLIAYAARCLKEEKALRNNTAVITVMANLGVVRAFEKMGVQAISTSVGDRYVSEEMTARDAVIGGEQSGHIIFREYLPTGDGLLSALQILSHLRKRKHRFSEIRNLFEKYPQVLLNVPVKHRKPIEDCPELSAQIQQARKTLGDEGRVFVRYSGTEPLLRIMLEGPSKSDLEKLAESIATSARRVLGSV